MLAFTYLHKFFKQFFIATVNPHVTLYTHTFFNVDLLTLLLELISADLVLVSPVKILLQLFSIFIVPFDSACSLDLPELLQVDVHATIENEDREERDTVFCRHRASCCIRCRCGRTFCWLLL